MNRTIRSAASIRAGRTRRGNVLLFFFFALLVFVPLALALFQYGVTTLTRRQMQTAVNSAALEGLRHRDQSDEDLEDGDVAPDWRDRVITMMDLVFDADFDPKTPDDRIGAGPTIVFDDQRIVRGQNIGVYKPDLQRNDQVNEPHGDIVAGDYHDDVEHSENANYERTDFTPTDPLSTFDSVLVRLRRTIDSLGNEPPLDALPGISSSGPAIPRLWGRGPSSSDERIGEIARGIRVRATAIAAAVPAMTVGITPETDSDLPGVTPFWIELEKWNENMNEFDLGNDESGDVIIEPLRVVTVGLRQSLDNGCPNMIIAAGLFRFVPIYFQFDEGEMEEGEPIMAKRVVGFGAVTVIQEINVSSEGGTCSISGRVRKMPEAIAHINASAIWRVEGSGLLAGVHEQLLRKLDEVDSPLLAPALMRTVGR